VALGSVLAGRTITILALAALPMLVLVMIYPKWFCRYVCPTGFLQELLGKIRPPSARWTHWPRLGRWLAVATLAGAAVGYPIFLWLDPLAMFNGFLNAWQRPLAGLGLPVVLVLTLVLPKLWCQRLCPLGGLQELVSLHRASHSPPGRREFLAAGAGAVGALLLRAFHHRTPLRPPGALAENRFAGVCVRCGNCVRVCPAHIIRTDFGGHGVASWLTPVLSFEQDYCREDCHRCTQVCPSGAIARLTLAEKRRQVIGPAKVDLEICRLANGEECTACIASCPYAALVIVNNADGFSQRPGVELEKCTGCGSCEVACPVTPRAIRVVPRAEGVADRS
jgi:MauM/NapG family ferredoxin protein